ncbi:hypothetical protein CW304_19315 [Bacillus sp. UFRGS-B20]|nr:hypothetical protein CW304_19315 [Bacillus sp. UFRGS-B20]
MGMRLAFLFLKIKRSWAYSFLELTFRWIFRILMGLKGRMEFELKWIEFLWKCINDSYKEGVVLVKMDSEGIRFGDCGLWEEV